MKIEHLNATFQPGKIGHPHGLQVTYLKDNSTRNIFIYHEDGKVGVRAGPGVCSFILRARRVRCCVEPSLPSRWAIPVRLGCLLVPAEGVCSRVRRGRWPVLSLCGFGI